MPKGYYKFLINPITDKIQYQVIKECIFKGKVLLSKLQLKGYSPNIVEKGAKLLELIPQNELRTYFEAQNKKNKTDIPEFYKVTYTGENIVGDNAEESFYSVEGGILIFFDETPSIIPIHFDSVYEVIIDENKLELKIDFYPPHKDGAVIRLGEIVENLKTMTIKAEINNDAIIEAITRLLETERPVLGVIAAKGIECVDGIDGFIEYFVFADGIGPTVDETGHTDYHNLNLVVPVAKDQKIALYHPAIPGKLGRNIFGEVLHPKEGEKCIFPSIENTYKSPEDNNLLLSKINGSAFFKRSNITISEDYYVPGDVDYHTGNLKTNGTIRISGDVKSGFQLDVGGNLIVGGCVEDAVINCNGSVSIKGGFIGTGKGIIKSEGSVKCHFINQQTIVSRDSIVIENECIDATLLAKNSIKIGGAKVSVLGGFIMAGKSVEAEFLGNIYNVKTIVETGYDYELKEELKHNKSLHEDLHEKLKKIKMVIIKLDRLNELDCEQKKMYELMKEQLILIEKNISELDKRNNEICKITRSPSKSVVKVKKTAYPGTIISINTHKLIVQDECINRTFCINEDGEIISI